MLFLFFLLFNCLIQKSKRRGISKLVLLFLTLFYITLANTTLGIESPFKVDPLLFVKIRFLERI